MNVDIITTLVCDFDGTLATCPYDFAQMHRAVAATAKEYDIPPEVTAHLGLLEIIAVGAEWLCADAERAMKFQTAAMARLSAIENEAARQTELLSGICDALQALKTAGYRLGIVTRNSTAAVKMIIGTAPLPYDALLTRDDVAHPKPHVEHALHMLRLLKSQPACSLMVGDHPMDIALGKAAGMPTVAVLTGQTSAANLRAAQPDLLLPSVCELTTLLLSEPPQSRSESCHAATSPQSAE